LIYKEKLQRVAFTTPLTFKEFVKNPIVALLFLAVLGLAYLQMENTKIYKETINEHKQEIRELRAEVRMLQDRIFELERTKK
jgi:Tfp pilus assembly protein PilO